jgi:hypothetical protein
VLSSNSQPQDQIQVLVQSLPDVLLGGSLGGSEPLSLGGSDPLSLGGCDPLSLGGRLSLVDSLSDRLSEPDRLPD